MAESFNLDESPRPPTFVQIRAPAGPGIARRMLFIVGVGIALAAVLGWAAYRLTVNQVAPVVMQAAPTVTETPSPQLVPADLNSELARLTIDAAASAPVWSRESLMDRLSPFDASVPDRQMLSGTSPADTRNATHAGSYEVSVRLGRGDTIGSALQKLGFEAEAIADAVSALTPHVRLKRLPIGLGMTLQIRPSEKEGAKPILQALTLQPEGRREITVERDDEGQYVVELPHRSTAR
ncbi:MAG: hypothetical protein GEV13_27255 [Rhodospirillales bacterium]|nr:hypothetical protein [Rhodospirillales bacterium]